MAEIDSWVEAQEFQITLDAQGKIIDYIDNSVRRPNTPEERIRQKMTQIIHCEFGYPISQIALERPINIGREIKRADIVVYNTPEACASNDQGNVYLIAEVKAPTINDSDGQLNSYLSATSAQGGLWTNGNRIDFFRKEVATGSIVPWLGIPKFEQAWDSIGKYKKSDLIVILLLFFLISLALTARIADSHLNFTSTKSPDPIGYPIRNTLLNNRLIIKLFSQIKGNHIL